MSEKIKLWIVTHKTRKGDNLIPVMAAEQPADLPAVVAQHGEEEYREGEDMLELSGPFETLVVLNPVRRPLTCVEETPELALSNMLASMDFEKAVKGLAKIYGDYASGNFNPAAIVESAYDALYSIQDAVEEQLKLNHFRQLASKGECAAPLEEGMLEVDEWARVSYGGADANGAYVQAWVWVDGVLPEEETEEEVDG